MATRGLRVPDGVVVDVSLRLGQVALALPPEEDVAAPPMTALSSDIPTRQITAVPPTAAPAAATPRQPKTVFVTVALVRRSCMSLPRMPEVSVPASRPALAPSRPALFSSRSCLRLIQRPSSDLSDIPARRMVSARFLLCSSWSSTLSCLARAFFDFASQRAMRLRARPAGSLSTTAFPSR
ncbi:MAG: hypothetical protein ACLT5H_08945 [Collinsella stercoris]|uniref:hypothetical protein n=1 Tax=Collinsella stercoris TaxID=147206 RepID=UPI003992A93F